MQMPHLPLCSLNEGAQVQINRDLAATKPFAGWPLAWAIVDRDRSGRAIATVPTSGHQRNVSGRVKFTNQMPNPSAADARGHRLRSVAT